LKRNQKKEERRKERLKENDEGKGQRGRKNLKPEEEE
jgi:hypothetical protein